MSKKEYTVKTELYIHESDHDKPNGLGKLVAVKAGITTANAIKAGYLPESIKKLGAEAEVIISKLESEK